ncbi:ABC-2 type transport system permease protein [Kribbella orskensis]|uniref:ABC-2 type transport system permease protein n=1 Tax=Kribbella orskensis TaxID=2512216 RepID=A0ABY2BC82_9ACTN|nr:MULTISPECIES: ABC transporter permease [Kribbella]TCN34876.1 ABC-2 type transport system permease protein [Kribbella sp. VKM Ac-2500]TCO15582.1 ABC-2 type transport system permease protein [Kribbella orskensis]
MAESTSLRRAIAWPGQYRMLVMMWIRSSLAYPASFALTLVSTMLITGTDFVAVVLMFSHIESFGGFSLGEMGLLYGTASMTLGLADLATGSIERIGQRIRTGELDVWLIRPVPAFIQAVADNFALRRLGRPFQAGLVLVIALGHIELDWTVAKGIVLVVSMLTGSIIFGAIFVLGAAFQFISIDSAELANSFTYGGQQLTQYPLSIFGKEIVRAVTFVVPLAFVNYYPVLFVLGKPAPLGLPSWIGLLAPVVAVAMIALASLAWRGGLRRYRSTGS